VRQPYETLSAGEGAGTLSDVSRPVGEGSAPVGEGSETIGEASVGTMHSAPVRDPGTRGMLSGPVSEMSRGPVYQRQQPRYGDSVTEASAGAVKHDVASPLGERISQPLRELAPLQAEMRARRARAEQAALAGMTEPMAEPIDGVMHAGEDTVLHVEAPAPAEDAAPAIPESEQP